MVMRPLSRAIHGIPRPYLRNRREGLIFFPAAAGTFSAPMDFAGQGRMRPGPEV
jgi:hypothetical protein